MRVVRTLIVISAAAIVGSVAVAAQSSSIPPTYQQPASKYSPAKTPWGDPDLQGVYTNKDENGVPLERPNYLPAQGTLSEAEFQKIVAQRLERARSTAGRIGGEETGAGPTH